MKAIIIGASLLFLSFSMVDAEIYKWIDEKGTVHFTEDPATIPDKYRDKVKTRPTEEDHVDIEKGRTEDTLKEKAQKRIRFTRDEFQTKLIINKNREQAISLIGPPDSMSTSSNSDIEFWTYSGEIAYDPLTKTVYRSVQITFQYWGKTDMTSFWIPGAKDKYPKPDYYAVNISFL